MMTPLKKHPGHGGFVALVMLVAATIVVWTSRSPAPGPAPDNPVARQAIVPVAAAAPMPAEPKPMVAVALPNDTRTHLTATGFAIYDERRTLHLSSPVHGWLQKTRATSLGRKVRQGEVLGVIYSAEVYFATVDLITQVREFHSQPQLDAERVKLLRWGMPKPMIDRIEKTMKPQMTLPLVARYPGVVVAEEGRPRQFVEPTGRELFLITDPAFAWVFVDIAEADVARVHVGTPAKLTIEGVARPLSAKVEYVFRRSEEGMRKLRFDIYKPGLVIQPNATVTAKIELDRK